MEILLDECLPRKLRRELIGHKVATVTEMGWAGTKNGALIALAESYFEVFITIDQNLQSQQKFSSKSLALILLVAPNNRLDTLRLLVPKLLAELHTIKQGQVVRISY